MTSASQNTAPDFLPGSGAFNNSRLFLTLLASAGIAFGFTVGLYAVIWGKPLNRLSYGVVVSLLPLLGALILFKLTRLFFSWQRAATVYFVLFVLVLIIQIFGRTISVYK